MNELGSVLITGGAGFFGKAFVKHLLEHNLSNRVCIYSRDEYKHAVMRDELNNDSRLRFFVGDVRDKGRLKVAMRGVDIVVHAAALKRIEVGAYCPDEMTKTNVIGSMNVIEACVDNRVSKVVALSTDKAFQPISAYGQSKALLESLFLAADNMYGDGPKFAVTRYGNVSGSTGSVIPRWKKMLETTNRVPVTDINATRFWMTVQEAVDLVIDTINTMNGGELNIPDLPAYRIGDLAEAMGAECDISGLPEHEKLHESMNGKSSNEVRMMSVDEIKKGLESL